MADKVMSYEVKWQPWPMKKNCETKTVEFKEDVMLMVKLDQLLFEAFAVVREGAKRILGLFPYKVQIMGDCPSPWWCARNAYEGKEKPNSIITCLPECYLAKEFVVTVNEYLSERDATEMGELYSWLGLSVGINLSKSPMEKKHACDIAYSTNSEIGFDCCA